MSRVAVPVFVTGVALAATEALGVSVTQSLKGSNAPTYTLTMGPGSVPQSYDHNSAHTRVQLWDATFQFSSDQDCKGHASADKCGEALCSWSENICSSGCATNLNGIAGSVGQVTPSGKITQHVNPQPIVKKADSAEECRSMAFKNILPAGLVEYDLVAGEENNVGTAALWWYSAAFWQNPVPWDSWGGLQISWDCPPEHPTPNSTVKDGNFCSMDVQGSGGGFFVPNKTQGLWMCAIPRGDGDTRTFEIGKGMHQCNQFSHSGQSFYNHLAAPRVAQGKDGRTLRTWPWVAQGKDGTTLVDIVIVNLNDLQ